MYPYTEDLLKLGQFKPSSSNSLQVQQESSLAAITTPLLLQNWQAMLESHPDKAFVSYLLQGISNGFRIGFRRGSPLQSAKKNLQSVADHPQVVDSYLKEEMQTGRVLGPFPKSQAQQAGWHINRFGVIPKKHQLNKWRLIVDLSFPNNASVNMGIDPTLCSLSYTRVDEVAATVSQLGMGTELAKADIKSAYRLVPVHPDDRPLLAMQWEGMVYVDAALPFGLRSAPKIFNALADALEWIVKHQGAQFLWHYLDDYITVGRAGSGECRFHCDLLHQVCSQLGVPLAVDKCEGPTTSITFLGIVIDSVAMELRLPHEKLLRIKKEIKLWQGKRSCSMRELQSLTGLLQHAASVVRPGRTFIRRLFDLLATVKAPHHHIRLNLDARSDVEWWAAFIEHWNGIAIMPADMQVSTQHEVVSDASGHWGCGAYTQQQWFQLNWAGPSASEPIMTKELVPIVIAAAVWGRKWRGQGVVCRCDNQAVVSVIHSRTSKNRSVMHLLRCLFFFEASFDYHLSAMHVPGVQNVLADDLSRGRLASFLQKAPAMAQTPTSIPQALREMVFNPMDWTSAKWRSLFNSILRQV